jgi:DNA-binding XRE family transcriptional regulator
MGKGYLHLKMLRKMLSITQKNISEILECSTSNYCKMENEEMPMPFPTACKIAEYINSKLVEMGSEKLTMEDIFFKPNVTNMKRVG